MNEEDLKEVGIGKLVHRRSIITAANEYKKKKERETGKQSVQQLFVYSNA